ncbi:NAD-dependent epimerase/dehydratase family protein [Thiothrix subterranea]|uniref:NAD-dependent epimerase/dehydratase family protein n=1 Tax=Thiothrix subterranea TaxID=2735563 RepID=A0AA51MJG8_9GAMM|nr:NAD-dependent epimerase/dehydratase family protein [Thiothrix subterranea]MDQ5768687.1 NAD-dependent epimerase/dehydratase family protein [Thiothrix subterranea]WML84839.1 NAD-dependent epimerase/dehydratase family protein [Thiothrix subterranea]
MQTILVTGANGFIGSHTLHWLAQQPNIRLIAACRDKRKIPGGFSGEVREGDLRDETYLTRLLEGVDVVVNAMAWTSLWGHSNESNALFFQPTRKLIDQYRRSNASRFVNISTTSAAAPQGSADALSEGIPRHFWPHLCNVIRIENDLRQQASPEKSVVNLRLGIFVGEHYGLGVLPILLPRLKTHLVPWVQGGNTHLPLVDGRDCGQAMGLAALTDGLKGFQSFNVVGKETPTVREVILFLHEEFGYPKPDFGVPFAVAYPFAWLMEKLDPIVPWEPLIMRSIIHLLEETHADNQRATAILGYQPQYGWRDSIRLQIAEMERRQTKPMRLSKPVG